MGFSVADLGEKGFRIEKRGSFACHRRRPRKFWQVFQRYQNTRVVNCFARVFFEGVLQWARKLKPLDLCTSTYMHASRIYVSPCMDYLLRVVLLYHQGSFHEYNLTAHPNSA